MPTRAFRTDIQALRALAIAVVVVNHLWPTLLTGGYVGVDVFFVISGFLITGHLMNEMISTGSIRLGAFYARRIRRLLPAALLVLAISAVLVWVFLPYPRWARNGIEIVASAGYVENWLLARLSVDYSALNDAASVAQHYWSLSVEEQFYLAWPVLILLAAAAVARIRIDVRVRTTALILLIAIVVICLGLSVWFTAVAPRQAYFATFTRAWEFGLGGVVALLAVRIRRRGFANIVAFTGLAAIAVSVFVYNGSTAFPGFAALVPVAGTAMVIAAGTGNPRLGHRTITDLRPVQWLGDVSYSLYLWHWPLIIVAPFAIGRELNEPMRIGILAVALLLAWGTKRFIEDPGRTWSYWHGSTRRSVALMVTGMMVVASLAGGLFVGQQARAAADSLESPLPTGDCVGPSALEYVDSCPDPFGPAVSTVMAKRNEYFAMPSECGPARPSTPQGVPLSTVVCDFADGDASATEVWLVGDSHAQQWQGAIFEVARRRGWNVTIGYLGGCPAADVVFQGFRFRGSPDEIEACRAWSRNVSEAVSKSGPDIVFTSMAARHQLIDDASGRPADEQFVAGLLADWSRWADAGIEVVAIADPPFNGEVRSPDCVMLNAADPLSCARPRSDAQPPDPLVLAVERAARPDIRLIDFTDRFCDDDQCYAVVGGMPVFFDADHLNLEYVRLLGVQLDRDLGSVSSNPRPTETDADE